MPLTFLLIWRLGICSFTHRSKQVGVKNFIAFYILLKTILTYCAGLYKLNIEFSGPSPQPITCIAFMEFDGCVTINQKSQISKSYTQWCITLQVLVMVTFFFKFSSAYCAHCDHYNSKKEKIVLTPNVNNKLLFSFNICCAIHSALLEIALSTSCLAVSVQ